MSQPAVAPLSSEESERLVATRRDLHAHPELAYLETRTAQIVAERLAAAGYTIQTGVAQTGVVARLCGSQPGKTLLLRADMDALPIQEVGEHDYRSQHAGVMHACGHDGHVAALLTTAERLASADLPGTLVLCFQPAEEGRGGAEAMIAAGVLDRVDAVCGIHLWNGLPTGTIGLAEGPVMAAVDRFDLVLRGQGGHGAMPHQTRDPLVAAAQLVTALQTIVSRETSPLDSCVVTVGMLTAGDTFNVIPAEARLSGTCRTYAPAAHAALPERFRRVVEGIAAAHAVEATIDYQRICSPTINHPEFTAWAREVAGEVFGPGVVRTSGEGTQTMAGEDFSAFLERLPGCFAFVGSKNPERGLIEPHHSDRFDFDESALEVSARFLEGVARRYLSSRGLGSCAKVSE
ncbi:MAG: amidohydrolase [Planctomycetes bacterium]|nr:amidohydrolase [Planctomycetota bacterium]